MSENETLDATIEDPKTEIKGLLYQSLSRTNKQIKQERGDAIVEDLEMAYGRKIEDLIRDIKRLQRDQTNMFDFSPTNSQSLMMGKDVDAQDILDKDLIKLIDIREKTIKLNLLKDRYFELFGKTLKA